MSENINVQKYLSPGLIFRNLILLSSVPGIGLLIWFNAFYTGDDRNTLFPVAMHSIVATLHYYIRPLEYGLVQVSNSIYLPLWILFSLLAAVGAAWFSVRTAELITDRNFDSSMRLLMVCANPLWFYTISQIDTVSQSLCNAVFSIGLFFLVKMLKEPDFIRASRYSQIVNIASSLLLFTKELAVPAALTLVAIVAWREISLRRANFMYSISCTSFIAALVVWALIKFLLGGMLPEAGGHYNMTPSLFDIGRNTAATFSFSLTPLPSSFLSFYRLANVWAVSGIASTLFFFYVLRKLKWSTPARCVALTVLGACFPMFYVHASELYASMVSSLLIATFILVLAPRNGYAWAYGIALLACSYFNCFVYYQSASSLVALLGARQSYSVYSGPNGLYNGGLPISTFCAVRSAREVRWIDGKLVCL